MSSIRKWGLINSAFFILLKVFKNINVFEGLFIKYKNENKFYNQFIKEGHVFTKSYMNVFFIRTKNGTKIYLRRFSSDIYVFYEIYIRFSYYNFIKLILDANIKPKYFLDLGANIGLASINFHEYFPSSTVICVEPSPANFSILQKNLKLNKIHGFLFNNAIWNVDKDLYLTNEFRDGEDWSISINESGDKKNIIKGLTISSILKKVSLETVDVLKIDIEGGEFTLFNDAVFLSHLSKIKAIAIEIHEDVGDKNIILNILENYGFNMIEIGDFHAGVRND